MLPVDISFYPDSICY